MGGKPAGIAAWLSAALIVLTPIAAMAQPKAPVKVRYTEVVRSILYAPAYVAISRGFFKDVGIDVTMSTANGGDKAMSALLANSADIALIGPETTIYVRNSESPMKAKIFCGLTATDGFFLVSRKNEQPFNWIVMKGKNVLGFRPGSTPVLFFEEALRKNGIDPLKDVKLANNVAQTARVGSWLAGQNDYGIFNEPDASQLEVDGKGFVMASIGETVGYADYTSFMASEKFIQDNPALIQNWTNAIYKAQKWTASASTADIAKILAEFFPGVSQKVLEMSVERHQKAKIWKDNPVIEPAAIEKFEQILVNGRVLDANKKPKFDDLVTNDFARKAQ